MSPLLTAPLVSGICLICAVASGETTQGAKMVRIPAGTFIMGSQGGDRDERPRRILWLGAFEIDRLEVSEASYSRCVVAGVCARRERPLSPRSRLPITSVRWIDAARYCRFVGKRLPSEAQWERAARGRDGRRFPWGATLDCSRANFGNFDGDGPCAGKNPGRPVKVGSYSKGASPSGVLDMAGNVWEWVADRYRGRGGEGPRDGRYRVLRGGSCCSYFAMPTTTNRYRLPERAVAEDVGFRCARPWGGTHRSRR